MAPTWRWWTSRSWTPTATAARPTRRAWISKSTGPATWRGGFCSDKLDTTNNKFLDTECGINRVAIRSTLTPGTITLTATRDGLEPATVQIESKPVAITDGLMQAGN